MHSHRTILTSLRHKHKELEEYIPDNEYMYKVDSVVRCQATQIPTLTYQLLMEDSDSDSNLNGSSGKTGKNLVAVNLLGNHHRVVEAVSCLGNHQFVVKATSCLGNHHLVETDKLSGKSPVSGETDKLSEKSPVSDRDD